MARGPASLDSFVPTSFEKESELSPALFLQAPLTSSVPCSPLAAPSTSNVNQHVFGVCQFDSPTFSLAPMGDAF